MGRNLLVLIQNSEGRTWIIGMQIKLLGIQGDAYIDGQDRTLNPELVKDAVGELPFGVMSCE